MNFQKHVEEHKKTLDVDNPRDLIDYFLVALQSDEKSEVMTYGGKNYSSCAKLLVNNDEIKKTEIH